MKKEIIIFILTIFMICLIFPIVSPIPLDYDEDGIEDSLQTGYFVYPLLPGIYKKEVDDWEVSVCIYHAGGKQTKVREFADVINTAHLRSYPGQIDSITAFVDKEIPDPDFPDNPTKTTNLYTVCWVVLPFGSDSMSFSVILKGQGSVTEDVIGAQTASAPSGAGDCKTIFSKKQLLQAFIGVTASSIPPANIIDRDTKQIVQW